MLVSGLAAGIVGSVAVVRKLERSWLVWLAILPALHYLRSEQGKRFIARLAG
jgi:hypothetical protein